MQNTDWSSDQQHAMMLSQDAHYSHPNSHHYSDGSSYSSLYHSPSRYSASPRHPSAYTATLGNGPPYAYGTPPGLAFGREGDGANKRRRLPGDAPPLGQIDRQVDRPSWPLTTSLQPSTPSSGAGISNEVASMPSTSMRLTLPLSTPPTSSGTGYAASYFQQPYTSYSAEGDQRRYMTSQLPTPQSGTGTVRQVSDPQLHHHTNSNIATASIPSSTHQLSRSIDISPSVISPHRSGTLASLHHHRDSSPRGHPLIGSSQPHSSVGAMVLPPPPPLPSSERSSRGLPASFSRSSLHHPLMTPGIIIPTQQAEISDQETTHRHGGNSLQYQLA